jgi:hypothetical protein
MKFSSDVLLQYVQWIASTSGYFSDVTTLKKAKAAACSTNTLLAQSYALWLDAAYGNVLMGVNLQDFCITSQTSSWYKKKSYNYYCRKFTYPPPNSPVNLTDVQTVGDALFYAEAALYSTKKPVRTAYTEFLQLLFTKQAPGAGGCPNTCGSSAAAARAISETISKVFTGDSSFYASMDPGVAAAVSAVVTAVVIISLTALLAYFMRDRVVKILA